MTNSMPVPILCRFLTKLLLCGIIIALVGSVGALASDADVASRATLQREVKSLQEQLELFEMKHETLQAASEQFRIQSKSAKSKLDEERKRYDILVSEKRSLEVSIESKVASALQDQKAILEDTISLEHTEKYDRLAKEHEELGKKLRRSEYQISMLERSMEEKLQDQSRRYDILERKRKAAEEKLRDEITDLRERLSFSEKQVLSFEDSWKNAIGELEEKDEYLQSESRKRMEEAGRWEERIQKLNAESRKLFEENQAKSNELTASKKFHMTLIDKLQASDEVMKQYEEKISELKNIVEERNEEKTELTKAYKEAIEHLSSKNGILRDELVDMKFELETNKNITETLRKESAEITSLNEKMTDQLGTVTSKFLESDMTVKNLTARIEEEKMRNANIKTELLYAELVVESSQQTEKKLSEKNRELLQLYTESQQTLALYETKQSESKQQNKKSQEHVVILQSNLNDLEGKVNALMEQLELKVAKNSYLEKTLLDTKYSLEESQSKVKHLEGRMVSEQTPAERDIESLEIENIRLAKRIEALERELQDPRRVYTGMSQEEMQKNSTERMEPEQEIDEKLSQIESEAEAAESNAEKHLKNMHSVNEAGENFRAHVTAEDLSETSGLLQTVSSFFRWLDYTLYQVLRVIVDSARWVLNELRIIHFALVSLFEFEMTFIASLSSSEKERTGFEFLMRHSEMIVLFGEAIAVLLCLDFIYSSIMNPRKVRRTRPRAKTIEVPKSANASLLRTANNM